VGPIKPKDLPSLDISLSKYDTHFSPFILNGQSELDKMILNNMTSKYESQFAKFARSNVFNLATDSEFFYESCTKPASTKDIDTYLKCVGKSNYYYFTDRSLVAATMSSIQNNISLIGHFNNQKFHRVSDPKYEPNAKVNRLSTLDCPKISNFFGMIDQGNDENSLKSDKNSYTINWETFREYTNNDEEFEKEMIDTFLIEIPKYLKDLEVVIKKKEFSGIKGAAHKIKCPLGILGLEELRSKFVKIEELSDKSEIIPIVKTYVHCKNSLERILCDLKVIRKDGNDSKKSYMMINI
jgi:HPt (histidine-containing phosphotransfer) domain-containing protein